MTQPPATSLIVGPPGHGVVRHALMVARASGAVVVRHRRPPSTTHPLLHDRGRVVHLHFTDRLYGDHVTAAADSFLEVARRAGGHTVATLHDIPSVGDDDRSRRRVTAYRRVARAVDAVIVTARHERDRLHAIGIDRPVHVVPFPIGSGRRPATSRPLESGCEIGILGFVYPGKGHALAIDVAAPGAQVVALGAVSPGHDRLADELRARACRAGVPLAISGALDDRAMGHRLATVDVPFAVYDDVSASMSMTSWIAAGRRPIVASSPFVDELLELVPGALVVVDRADRDQVARAVLRACSDPVTTRLCEIPAHLSERAIGDRHLAIYRTLRASE